MTIECPSCSSRFHLADGRVPERGARVRCSRCQHRFFVNQSGQVDAAPPTSTTGTGTATAAGTPATTTAASAAASALRSSSGSSAGKLSEDLGDAGHPEGHDNPVPRRLLSEREGTPSGTRRMPVSSERLGGASPPEAASGGDSQRTPELRPSAPRASATKPDDPDLENPEFIFDDSETQAVVPAPTRPAPDPPLAMRAEPAEPAEPEPAPAPAPAPEAEEDPDLLRAVRDSGGAHLGDPLPTPVPAPDPSPAPGPNPGDGPERSVRPGVAAAWDAPDPGPAAVEPEPSTDEPFPAGRAPRVEPPRVSGLRESVSGSATAQSSPGGGMARAASASTPAVSEAGRALFARLTVLSAGLMAALLLGAGLVAGIRNDREASRGPVRVRTGDWEIRGVGAMRLRSAQGSDVLVVRGRVRALRPDASGPPVVRARLLDAEGRSAGAVDAQYPWLELSRLSPPHLQRYLDALSGVPAPAGSASPAGARDRPAFDPYGRREDAAARPVDAARPSGADAEGFTILIPQPPDALTRFRLEAGSAGDLEPAG